MYPNGKMDLRGRLTKIEGGPAWINTEVYQITAKADGPADIGIVNGPMMQALLEERFRLKVRREVREVPVYALVVSKNGLKLPIAKMGCITPGPGRITWEPGQTHPPICGNGKRTRKGIEMHGATMAEFCQEVSAGIPLQLGRPVIDKTGVAGQFDFDLIFADEDSAPRVQEGIAPLTPSGPDPDFAPMQEALRRVGLQLASAKGTGEFLIIDHVERPSPN
jgi:uncharacterized protein (TIGR03435 family)